MAYNYEEGKNRILNILNDKNKVDTDTVIPTWSDFDDHNGYHGWITTVVIHYSLPSNLSTDLTTTSKIIRLLSTEINEIMKDDRNFRDIGFFSNCIYVIYSTPLKIHIYNIADKVFYINTLIKMVNSLLNSKGIGEVQVKIGLDSNESICVKTYSTLSNELCWSNDSVIKCYNMTQYDIENPIIMSSSFFENMVDSLKEDMGNDNCLQWFSNIYKNNERLYTSDIIKTKFNNWILNGMK